MNGPAINFDSADERSPDDIAADLRAASDAYYNTGKTLMTDAEFDALRDELRRVAPSHSFFSEVGSPVSGHRDEVRLLMHMGSQNKAKDEADMLAWFEKAGKPEVIVSDKADGSSAEAVYRGGMLWRVATRGDGKIGMDITRNARMWEGLPEKIDVKAQVIVRGEAQLSVSAWREHLPDKENPRNGGNGVIVAKSDPSANKYITFRAFDLVHPEVAFEKQSHKFKALEHMGFETIRWFRCRTWDNLIKCRRRYEETRAELEFEIDGMVVAIEDLEKQASMGYSDGGSRPRGQVAWKFETEKAESKILSIELTIGQTGAIIPTAVFEPVRLAGTTVKHCLLNNFKYIGEKNINVGDVVEVEKGGDIIPHITRVVKKNTPGPFPPPGAWKASDGKEYDLSWEGKRLLVTDPTCPDLYFQRIKNWVDKLDIKQLGETALRSLVGAGLVKDIDDLYSLDEASVSKCPVGNGVIGGNAKKIVSEIAKTREIPIDMFMGSLSIKMLGRSRVRLIGIDTVEEYLGLVPKDLVGKPFSEKGTFGEEPAKEVVESIQARKDLIERLAKIIRVTPLKKEVTDGKLSGKTFCFSGVRMSPDQQRRLEAAGGKEKKSVSKGLSYLVLKDPASTKSKAQKARKLGVQIIGMEEFEAML